MRIEYQRPGGELNPLSPPEWKWENITIDFMTTLPRIPSGHEVVWVMVDRLTKSAHFIPLRVGCSLEKMAEIYIKEIVRLRGMLVDIVLDRDPMFIRHFWQSFT